MALPIFSVQSLAEGRRLQTLMCRLAWDGRYLLPFSGRIDDLDEAAERLADGLIRLRSANRHA